MVLSLVVLISGGGSNLRALLEASNDAEFPARVVAIGADRDTWGDALLEQIQQWQPDLTVLSGFMRLLPPRVVAALSPHLINTHPAYLPEFPGAHGVRDALAAGVDQTGASLIVVHTGVDDGPIISQERVPVLPDDTQDSLHDRIKLVERRLLVQAVLDISNGHVDLKEHSPI
jgi:phosphoribosylglycinamide formyltransferase-1